MFEHKAVKLVERELLNLKLLVKLKTRITAPHYLKWLYFEVSDAWSDIGAIHFNTDTNQGEEIPARAEEIIFPSKSN